MNYILVATDTATGSRKIKGPITGKDWLVTSQGSWIADEFDRTEKYLHLEAERYCSKLRKTIKTKIFLISPSWQQLEEMPIDGGI